MPDQIDVFSWSMPFLADKVMTMLRTLLLSAGADEDMIDEDLENEAVTGVVDAAERAKKVGVSKIIEITF